MHERIKSLRLALGLNQTAFGARLGVRQTTVAGWETGLRVPSDAVVISICREFGVSPEWLKLGVGEMFAPRSREEELAAFFGQLSRDPDGSVRKRFIGALAKLPLEAWDAIDAFCREAYGIAPPGADPPAAGSAGESLTGLGQTPPQPAPALTGDGDGESRPAEAPPGVDHA